MWINFQTWYLLFIIKNNNLHAFSIYNSNINFLYVSTWIMFTMFCNPNWKYFHYSFQLLRPSWKSQSSVWSLSSGQCSVFCSWLMNPMPGRVTEEGEKYPYLAIPSTSTPTPPQACSLTPLFPQSEGDQTPTGATVKRNFPIIMGGETFSNLSDTFLKLSMEE